jgi:hypothetical protein
MADPDPSPARPRTALTEGTELSVTESGYAMPEAMDMSRAGQEQVLDKLAQSAERG